MKFRKGFTLIELLVVISIIALLVAILMPALNKAKQQATAAVCLNNESQLSKAYIMYAMENDDFLMDAKLAGPGFHNGFSWADRNMRAFMSVPMDINGNASNMTMDDKIRGFKEGALWKYIQTHEILNCPGDKRINKSLESGDLGGFRSYSLGAVLSRMAPPGTGEDVYSIKKLTEFARPSSKIVWLEEADGSGFNRNFWDIFLNERKWYDPVAIWHNDASTFGFADGHAEQRKWSDKNMIEMAEKGGKVVVPDGKSNDYDWFVRSYIPGR